MTPVDIGPARLYCGDAREALPFYIEGVDHFILDPPYEEEMHEAKKRTRHRHRELGVLRNDGQAKPRVLDFASIDGVRQWIADTCKGRGWFIAFCTPEGVAPWRDAAAAAGHRYKRACVWVKPDAAPQFNGQGPAMGAEMFVTTWTGTGHSRWNGGGRRNVFTHPVNPSSRDGLHPTEKPVALMMEIVALFTNPGDLVCDPFMGTGATGVAALRLGRRFVGVERRREYFDRAVLRIGAVTTQPDMFVPRKRGKQSEFDGMPHVRRKTGGKNGKTESSPAEP